MNDFYNYLEISIQTRIVYLHPSIRSESSMPSMFPKKEVSVTGFAKHNSVVSKIFTV